MKLYKYLDYVKLFYLKLMRFRLKKKNFSIISNDCWGGSVYLDLGIPYTSPTVNLFIYSSSSWKARRARHLEKFASGNVRFKIQN